MQYLSKGMATNTGETDHHTSDNDSQLPSMTDFDNDSLVQGLNVPDSVFPPEWTNRLLEELSMPEHQIETAISPSTDHQAETAAALFLQDGKIVQQVRSKSGEMFLIEVGEQDTSDGSLPATSAIHVAADGALLYDTSNSLAGDGRRKRKRHEAMNGEQQEKRMDEIKAMLQTHVSAQENASTSVSESPKDVKALEKKQRGHRKMSVAEKRKKDFMGNLPTEATSAIKALQRLGKSFEKDMSEVVNYAGDELDRKEGLEGTYLL